MPALINIPVPAGIGATGAAVDVSNVNTNMLVMNPFAAAGDIISLEQSFDNFASPGQIVATFSGNTPAAQLLDVEGLKIRARRLNGSGGAYNLQGAAQQAGAASNFNLAVPASGSSATQDISGQSQWLNCFLDTGNANDFAQLAVSLDNVNFVGYATLQGTIPIELQCGANSIQVNRLQGGNAGTLRVSGIPAKG